MLKAFQVEKVISQYGHTQMWEKLQSALKVYYEKRQRPSDKRMLIPTLHGCANGQADQELFDRTRGFLSKHLVIV